MIEDTNAAKVGADQPDSGDRLTLRQANDLGGAVRKGEHGEIVIFWKVDWEDNSESYADAENIDECEKSRRRFVLRFYRVWNVEQCELPQAVLDRLPKIETYQHDPIEAAERIITNMPNSPAIEYGGTRAFYSTSADRIMVPPRELFISAEEHFGTWAHEASRKHRAPEAA
jgi:antirestriction protein ArdC